MNMLQPTLPDYRAAFESSRSEYWYLIVRAYPCFNHFHCKASATQRLLTPFSGSVCGPQAGHLGAIRRAPTMSTNSRQYWSMSETKALLNIWADETVQQKMEGVCRNEEVIQFMVEELAKLGIQRTTTQVREKLKKMRHSYKTVKSDGRKTFPFFDLMDSVLGRRRGAEGPKCINAPLAQLGDKSHSTESSGTSAMRKGNHPGFHRVRSQTHKRRADSDTTKEFLSAMTESHRQWLEREQEQRREEWERESKLRHEEMRQELTLRREEAEREERLRREEMEARSKDSELLTSCLMQIAKLISKDSAAL